jgi:uncharacterized SAM-binding protein YcdF (DUF218 family)
LTSKRPVRKIPARRPARHPLIRRRLGWRGRLIIIFVSLILGLFIWAEAARLLAPTSNTSLTRFDAIIVLGYRADTDGNPTPEQLSRVTEGVREYERGVAPRLIFTGAAVGNRFVEAQIMAREAEAEGIPRSAIFVEPRARDTIQNACFSVRIMKEHGWRSAEVVSRASHLPRAAMIFGGLPVEWRTHVAPPLQPESAVYRSAAGFLEVVKTARYLVWARWWERCEP